MKRSFESTPMHHLRFFLIPPDKSRSPVRTQIAVIRILLLKILHKLPVLNRNIRSFPEEVPKIEFVVVPRPIIGAGETSRLRTLPRCHAFIDISRK